MFGSTSRNTDNKVVTSLLFHKPYLKTKFIKTKIEEEIDMKNQFRINNLKDPFRQRSSFEKLCWYFTLRSEDNTNSSQVDFDDRNPDRTRFVEVNSTPAVG